MFYLFYNPSQDNKVMGMSDSKTAMQFPYLESEESWHGIENILIDRNKNIRLKKGTIDAEEVGRIKERRSNLGMQDIKSRMDSGKINEKQALREIMQKLDNFLTQ